VKPLRGLVIGTVVTLILVLLLAVGDIAARDYGQRRVAEAVQQALGLSESPTVRIGGWPFLLHAATRSFPSAEAEIGEMPIEFGGERHTISTVSVHATDITPRGDGFLIAEVSGTGTVGYSTLTDVIGHQASYGGDQLVRLEVDIPVVGAVATVLANVSLDVAAQQIALTDVTIEVAGVTLPTQVSQPIIAALTGPIPVSNDVFTVESVTLGEQGALLSVSATDLSVPGS
jgi:hypothetical protein